MVLIILEGCDKTGKSTLSEYLIKNLNNTFLAKIGNRPKDGSFEERIKIANHTRLMLEVYNKNFMMRNYNLLLDRLIISELVYSYKRDYNPTEFFEEFQSVLKEREDVIVIFCNTSFENIKQKFIEDKEDYVNIEDIKTLQERYETTIKALDIKNLIRYDYTKNNPEDVLNILKNHKY